MGYSKDLQAICKQEVDDILKTHLSHTLLEEQMLKGDSKSGMFCIKSAYYKIMRMLKLMTL